MRFNNKRQVLLNAMCILHIKLEISRLPDKKTDKKATINSSGMLVSIVENKIIRK